MRCRSSDLAPPWMLVETRMVNSSERLMAPWSSARWCRLQQAEVGVADADTIAAEGAGVAIGFQNFVAEIGDAAALGFGRQIEAHGGENVLVNRRGKVGGLADQEQIAAKGFVDGRGEAAVDGVADQFAL